MSKVIDILTADTTPLFATATNGSRNTHVLASATSAVVIMSVAGFISIPTETIYYACLAINFIYLLSHNGSQYNRAFIFLYFILILNVLVVDIPAFFRPQMRLGLFLLMTSTTASLFDSQESVNFRRYIFKYVTYGLAILAVGSFFAFFMGINMMKQGNLDFSDFSTYSSNGGWFGGLTKHSMMLGPISMIASLFFFMAYLQNKRNIYLVLFFTCAMSAVMASSRAAILGVAAALFYCLLMMKMEASMKRSTIVLLIICGIATLPIYDVVFAGIIDKQHKRMEATENINSRQNKFDYRIAEFESSPILGVGFCAVDVNGEDDYGVADGRIEPGTSHLAVLSMTGLLGMLAYVIILLQAYRNAKSVDSPHARFVLLCFIAMFVHAWFEGYVFSAGGFLAFLYWLIIGQCVDCKQTE